MILLLDNYDSFTYNLYQQIEALGFRTTVEYHDKITIAAISRRRPSKIVISPGPKRPANSGICLSVIRKFFDKIPILGVCLGHECLAEAFGSNIVHARKVMHGKTSMISHGRSGLFRGIPSPFRAARYHSLVVDHVPDNFHVTARDSAGQIMGISHNQYPLHGIQFHPESFMTQYGNRLMRNFLHAD